MGNYRFKLSDLIPNSWLPTMSKTRKKQHKIPNTEHRSPSSSLSSFSSPSISAAVAEPKPHQRKSYYFTRGLTRTSGDPVQPPRRSSRTRRGSSRRNRRLVSSSVYAGCSCRATLESVCTKPAEDYSNSFLSKTSTSDRSLTTPDSFDGMVSWSTSSADMRPFCKGFDIVSDQKVHLPPIITSKDEEPAMIQTTSAEFSEESAYGSMSVKVVKKDIPTCITSKHQPKKTASYHSIRRYSPNSPSHGVKLRSNSPRVGNRRISTGRRSSVSSNSSFAVMKSSKDPGRDFRESMVEMIVENNIRASSDLEDLLACYLLLNSSEYHDLIINVFKQIWFDFLRK